MAEVDSLKKVVDLLEKVTNSMDNVSVGINNLSNNGVISNNGGNFNSGVRISGGGVDDPPTPDDLLVRDYLNRGWINGQRVKNKMGYTYDSKTKSYQYYKYDNTDTRVGISKEEYLREKHALDLKNLHRTTGQHITKIVEQVADAAINIFKTWADYHINITKKGIEASNSMAKAHFNAFGKTMNQSMNNVLSGVGKTATATAYASANNQIEQANTYTSFLMERHLIQKKLDVGVKSEQMSAIAKTTGAVIGALTGIVGTIAGPLGTAVGMTVGTIVGTAVGSIANKAISAITDIKIKRMQLDVEERESIKQQQELLLNSVAEQAKSILSFSENNEKNVLSINKSSTDLVRSFGYGVGQMSNVQKNMFNISKEISNYGKTTDDFIKIQNSYISTSGRALSINGKDANNIFATAMNFGIGDTEASNIFGSMNIFNTSISDGVDQLNEMRKIANKIGISSNKFAKDLTKNLELAQKYNFKGGVEGMMKMTMWAEKARFNMQNLTSLVDNIMDGGVENVLTKSAQLQVLGGNAAIYSDPLGMMYDAGADPESLAKRMHNSFRGFGTFNRNTGETSFSWGEDAMIRSIAKAYGMSHDDAKKMIREQQKNEEIRKYIGNRGFSDEELAGISSKATYDRASKRWRVGLIDGGSKDIAELTSGDLNNLLSNDNTEKAVEYAQGTMDVNTKQLAVQKNIETMFAALTGFDVLTLIDTRIADNKRNYTQNSGVFSSAAIDGSKFSNESQNLQFKAGLGAINKGLYKDYMSYSLKTTEELIKGQDDLSKVMNKLIESINGNTRASLDTQLYFAELSGNQEAVKHLNKQIKHLEDEVKRERNKVGRDNVFESEIPTYKNGGGIWTNLAIGLSDVSMNDGMIIPASGGSMVQTNPNDVILAAKMGGPFDQLFNGVFKKIDNVEMLLKTGNLNVGVNGKIELASGGKTVEITNELAHELSKVLISEISKNANGGRGELFPNRYSGVGKF